MNRFLTLLVLLALLSHSCGKMEIPDDAGKKPTSPTPAIPTDTLSVARAKACPADTFVVVKGYIVGYIEGTSIATGACFGCPDDAANTNMLLADVPGETDYEKCLPVKLENSTNYGFRAELNLYDTPDNYQRHIALYGPIGTYFRTTGMVRIIDFTWLAPGDVPPPAPGIVPPGIELGRDTLLEGR